MNKLSYGSYSSDITDIAFSSTNGYTDPSSELETRKQLSTPLKEIKDFVNNTVPVDSNDNAVQLVVTEENKLQYKTDPGSTPVDIEASGVPEGGTAGQMIVKNSSTDFDASWVNGIPTGGSSGQVLKKSSNTNYAMAWKDNTVDVLTSAPSSAYTGGGAKIVYLTSEPGTKYAGYIYLIKG